jgi:hypothetical protein
VKFSSNASIGVVRGGDCDAEPGHSMTNATTAYGLPELAAAWDRDGLFKLAVTNTEVVLVQVDRRVTMSRT